MNFVAPLILAETAPYEYRSPRTDFGDGACHGDGDGDCPEEDDGHRLCPSDIERIGWDIV